MSRWSRRSVRRSVTGSRLPIHHAGSAIGTVSHRAGRLELGAALVLTKLRRLSLERAVAPGVKVNAEISSAARVSLTFEVPNPTIAGSRRANLRASVAGALSLLPATPHCGGSRPDADSGKPRANGTSGDLLHDPSTRYPARTPLTRNRIEVSRIHVGPLQSRTTTCQPETAQPGSPFTPPATMATSWAAGIIVSEVDTS